MCDVSYHDTYCDTHTEIFFGAGFVDPLLFLWHNHVLKCFDGNEYACKARSANPGLVKAGNGRQAENPSGAAS